MTGHSENFAPLPFPVTTKPSQKWRAEKWRTEKWRTEK